MTDDLISRSELKKEIERIKRNIEEWVNHTDCDKTFALAKISIYEIFIDFIDNAPTVEPEVYMNGKDYNLYLEGYKQGKKDFEKPQDRWGKWVISEIQCPNCLEYFPTDCYSKEDLNICPCCGADMRKGESE